MVQTNLSPTRVTPTPERFYNPANDALIVAARIEVGARTLNLVCGSGYPAIPIAIHVGPSGSVLATDPDETRVRVARDEAKAKGISNIEFRCLESERLDMDDESFDAVTMRHGLMFVPDAVTAMKGAYRVLRAGRNIALSVWAELEHNPYILTALQLMVKHAGMPMPQLRGFSWADDKKLRALLEGAGFRDVRIEPLEFTFAEFPSAADYWAYTREFSPPLKAAYQALPESVKPLLDDEVPRAAEAFRTGDKIVFPSRAWLAWGTK